MCLLLFGRRCDSLARIVPRQVPTFLDLSLHPGELQARLSDLEMKHARRERSSDAAYPQAGAYRSALGKASSDVLAGIFYGWIHSNVGTLVQARYAKGKLLVCTFSLATTYASDPYASYLLDALVRYAASDFLPRFEIPSGGK